MFQTLRRGVFGRMGEKGSEDREEGHRGSERGGDTIIQS